MSPRRSSRYSVTMHKALVIGAYGWLTPGGVLHFGIDVLSQYLRGKRVPGPEATGYYASNTAYALSQVLVGVGALLVYRAMPELLSRWPATVFSLVAAAAWLAFGFVFIEYREPKIVMVVFIALLIGAAATR